MARWIVWRLPKRVLYWAVIRVWADATIEAYPDTEPDKVTWSMAIKTLE